MRSARPSSRPTCHFKQWGTVFPGAACVVALVDRFVQHCHVLDIEGESWRQKEPATPLKSRKQKK
jgi:DNA replication protein DnaC